MGRSYLAWTAAAALALSAPAHAAVANVDVLSRCQAILTDASSSSVASTPSFMTLADSELPATVSAALSARSLKWSSLSDVMRIGLLWAYGFVLPGGGKGALVQVYTDCDSADRDSPVGRFMDNITLAADRFALTKCANNTCGTFFQATNDKCSPAVADEMLCAVDATGLPVSNESFWADTGSDSSEVPYPQLYTHSLEVANASKPLNVVSIHMAASVGGSSRCGNTGVAIVPCLALSEVSSAQKFCRPQVDPAQVKSFLEVVAKTIADASDAASATTTKNDEKTSSGGLSTGAIIGIAGGALVVLGLIAFYFFRSKKSRSNARNDPEYPGFGRKSSNGNGARPAVAQGFNTNKPRSFERQGTSNTVPLMENGTTFSTDYLAADNALDEDSNQRSFPPQRRRNSSLLGTSRGGKTFEDYYEESEVIRAFVDDPQIKIRRIPYEELTVLRILSKGSYGEVFLGQLETRHIAMKRLLPEKKHLTKSIEQFMGEIQIMCNLEHRNIVTFVGVSWDYLQNISVIVEYMDNGDLSEVLAKSKNKYTWQKEKISISMDIAEGLVYLHSMRPVIVHRDLKSKNVLLNKRGQAKLSDFGVSRKTTVNETMTSGVGTLLWTAPEIIEGRKYSEKADIFSLGVVLSEIDTCEEPYSTVKSEDTGERLPGMQIVQMVRLGQLKVNFRDDCPPKLRELAQQCTSLDPDMRPTSMEVAYTLKSIIAPSLRASS